MNNNRSYNFSIKFLTFSLVLLTTLFTFMSCENFLQGEDVKEEITRAIEYNNSSAYAINVEALTGTGTIKTPATGEVVKKVTDTFTVRFEPAENHKFVRWEAVVKGMSTGEKAADYISFEDSESLETKVTFKKASAKTIVIRPVCPEVLSVTDFSQNDAGKEYPRDSSVILSFNNEIENVGLDKISIKISGIDDDSAEFSPFTKTSMDYFKTPKISNKQVIFLPNIQTGADAELIPVKSGSTRLVTVTIPANTLYYINKKYLEEEKVYLEKEVNYTYLLNSETSQKNTD